jgi:hypothetical protein
VCIADTRQRRIYVRKVPIPDVRRVPPDRCLWRAVRHERPSSPSRWNWLPDSQQVTFAVAEPRAPLTDALARIIPGNLCNPIDRL